MKWIERVGLVLLAVVFVAAVIVELWFPEVAPWRLLMRNP